MIASLTRLKEVYTISNQIMKDASSLWTKNQVVNKTILLEKINELQSDSVKKKVRQKYDLLSAKISLRVDKYYHLILLFKNNEEIIESIIADIKEYKSSIAK